MGQLTRSYFYSYKSKARKTLFTSKWDRSPPHTDFESIQGFKQAFLEEQ